MGIKGLFKLLREKIKEEEKEELKRKELGIPDDDTKTKYKPLTVYRFRRLKGITVAIDASLAIYRMVYGKLKSGPSLVNREGKLTSHLRGIFYNVLTFLQNDIIPIYVFDGKAPDIKSKTIEKRKLRKDRFKLTGEDIKEVQILLDLMGIPYIIAPGEADVICSWLCARHDSNGKRYVKGVCTEDSDMLPLGAPYMFKDMLGLNNLNKNIIIVKLKDVLGFLGLTMNEFIDLCVLLGCDYCDNIKGIGPKNAYKLIVEYRSLDKVLEFLHKSNKITSTKTNKSVSNTLDDSDNSEDSDNEIKDSNKIDISNDLEDSEENSDSDSSDEVSDNIENEICMLKAAEYFRTALKEIDESKTFVLTDDQLKLRQYQHDELMDFMCVKHNFDPRSIKNGIDRLNSYNKSMNITRPNKKVYHKIIEPKGVTIPSLSDDINFIDSDTDSDKENNESEKFESKNYRSKTNLIKKNSRS